MKKITIVVWHNTTENQYYYKIVKGTYTNYEVGYRNSYNHKVISIIPNVYIDIVKPSFKERLIKRIIRFLEKKIR